MALAVRVARHVTGAPLWSPGALSDRAAHWEGRAVLRRPPHCPGAAALRAAQQPTLLGAGGHAPGRA